MWGRVPMMSARKVHRVTAYHKEFIVPTVCELFGDIVWAFVRADAPHQNFNNECMTK